MTELSFTVPGRCVPCPLATAEQAVVRLGLILSHFASPAPCVFLARYRPAAGQARVLCALPSLRILASERRIASPIAKASHLCRCYAWRYRERLFALVANLLDAPVGYLAGATAKASTLTQGRGKAELFTAMFAGERRSH